MTGHNRTIWNQTTALLVLVLNRTPQHQLSWPMSGFEVSQCGVHIAQFFHTHILFNADAVMPIPS